jgi:nitronate monooxygenase
VAVTCNAGALGSLAAAYLSPEQIDAAVKRIVSLTSRPYAINLFTPMPQLELSAGDIDRATDATMKFRHELGLARPQIKPPYHPDFDNQFEAVLRAKPKIFSFVFGLLDKNYIEACREHDIFTIGTATSLEEARALAESGVDAVVAQGFEAGGHRGIFDPQAEDPKIATMDLTRLISSKLKLPIIIAAGGIMTGAGIAEALKAGAQAAMLGTAFLLCPEAGTSKAYRRELAASAAKTTELTRAFSGRLARGIQNRFMNEMINGFTLPFPAQNALTRDIRNRAGQTNQSEYLSLWAGRGVNEIQELGAAELVKTLLADFRDAKS